MLSKLLLLLIVGALKLCSCNSDSTVNRSNWLAIELHRQSVASFQQCIQKKETEINNFFRNAAFGFDYVTFLDALDRNDDAALTRMNEKTFKEAYYNNALVAAVNYGKVTAFKNLRYGLATASTEPKRPIRCHPCNLENFILSTKDWQKNSALVEIYQLIQDENKQPTCPSAPDFNSSSSSSSYEKRCTVSYLRDMMRFGSLTEVKMAYGAANPLLGLEFKAEAVLVQAIRFNNVRLVRELLEDGAVDTNHAFPAKEELSRWDEMKEKIAQFGDSINSKSLTPLMYAVFLARGEIAQLIAKHPPTKATMKLDGWDALDAYFNLPYCTKGIVTSALKVRNEHDISVVNRMLCECQGDSFAESILNSRPKLCIQAHLWKGMDNLSFDAVLAAVRMGRADLLETFAKMDWITFSSLDHSIRAKVFEALLTLSAGEFQVVVKTLLSLGFDFDFGGLMVGDHLYVPTVHDYALTKRMSHALIDKWFEMLKQGNDCDGKALPRLPVNLMIMNAIDTFDKRLIEILLKHAPTALIAYKNPLTEEPLLHSIAISYYPATRDAEFVLRLKDAGFDKSISFKPNQELKRWLRIKMLTLSDPYISFDWYLALGGVLPLVSQYCHTKSVCFQKESEWQGEYTFEAICRGTIDDDKLLQNLKIEPIEWLEMHDSISHRYSWITHPACDDLHYKYQPYGNQYWIFHSSLVVEGYRNNIEFWKEDIEDGNGFGPEGYSALHLILSPRAAHHRDKKLMKLLKYFVEERGFSLNLRAQAGEPITYTDWTGATVNKTTDGWTAFMLAVARRKFEFADYLAGRGANIYISARDGTSLLREYREYLDGVSSRENLKICEN